MQKYSYTKDHADPKNKILMGKMVNVTKKW
jgi:hypothetical protein